VRRGSGLPPRRTLTSGMKTEQKYSKLIIFVFYIMNRFLTWKIVSFNWFHNHFQPFFLYSLIAKCRNIPNQPFSFFHIVSPFSTVSDRFHPCTLYPRLLPLWSSPPRRPPVSFVLNKITRRINILNFFILARKHNTGSSW
jgi:hypothetical protein